MSRCGLQVAFALALHKAGRVELFVIGEGLSSDNDSVVRRADDFVSHWAFDEKNHLPCAHQKERGDRVAISSLLSAISA
jgi:hypothetical protein